MTELASSVRWWHDKLTWAVVLVVAVALAPYAVPVFSADAMYEYALKWVDMPLVALAGALFLSLALRSAHPRLRKGWFLLAAGFGCWLLGRLDWAFLGGISVKIDLIADFLYLQVIVAMLVFLEMDPGRPALAGVPGQLRQISLLGGVIFLLAVFSYFNLIPALIDPEIYDSWRPSVTGTLLFDIYLLVRLVMRLRQAETAFWRRVYGLLALAWSLWVVADTADLAVSYVPDYFPPMGTAADLWWLVPITVLIVGLASLHRSTAPVRESAIEPSRIMVGVTGGTPLVIYAFLLPLTHAILGMTGMSASKLTEAHVILVIAVTVTMASLIVWAHRLTLAENQRLQEVSEQAMGSLQQANQNLESRVVRRTAALSEANDRLAADLVQREEVTAALRAAEAQRQALIRAIPDDLVLLGPEGRIKEVIQGGMPGEHLVQEADCGRSLSALLPEYMRQTVTAAIAQTLHEGEMPRLSLKTDTAEGPRNLEFRFSRCLSEDVLVLVEDVTERTKLAAALLQTQKMESLGVMAGGIAHDFNNILTSIIGNAQLLGECLVDAQSLEYLEAVQRNSRRAAKLTANLLAYAGDAHVELARLDLVALVGNMDGLLGASISRKSRFVWTPAAKQLWVEGNEAQLTQVVLNLVRNAGEALVGQDGSVTVSMGEYSVAPDEKLQTVDGREVAAGDYVCLRVADTGHGISAENRSRIFDPFFTSKGTGRGLGLAAVQGIISHHGGYLVLDSTPGIGTTFSVFLPRRSAAPHEASSPARPQVARGGGTVLVVDDEEELRRLVAVYLQRRGFATVEAKDGHQAVALAHQHRDDLVAICMDYAMPYLTGVEAHRQIRSENAKVPIIIMSGFGEGDALGGLAGAEATAFLSKPFLLPQLVTVLGQQLGVMVAEGEG